MRTKCVPPLTCGAYRCVPGCIPADGKCVPAPPTLGGGACVPCVLLPVLKIRISMKNSS